MISFQFPPDTGSIQRILSFTRYLQEYSWTPIILTHKTYKVVDSETDNEFINKGIKVYRTGREHHLISRLVKQTDSSLATKIVNAERKSIKRNSFLKLKYFFKKIRNFIIWPDIWIWWIPLALIKAIKIIRQENIRSVYIVTPPHSASIIGYLLKKIFGINIILDFRDPWANDVDIIMPTALHQLCHKFAEKLVINSSDAVITTTDFHKKYFLERIRSNSRTKVYTITNGVDLELLKTNTFTQIDNFSIIYTGNFDSTRNPKTFFEAISNIHNNYPEVFLPQSIKFFGNINTIVEEEINRLGLSKIVKQFGLLSFDNVIKEISRAALLLLIVHNDENTSKFCIPAKLFEYMATGRPILAVTPPGAAAEIIATHQLGQCIEHSDIPGIERAVLSYYTLFKAEKLQTTIPDPEILNKYDRKYLTKELANVLDNHFN